MESWHKEILAAPRPTTGCFTATYPDKQWRTVPCKTPPTKVYPPRHGGTSQTNVVGGASGDWAVGVTGSISVAKGSFDTVEGVSSECAVQCPNGTCPANPVCRFPDLPNTYSLQLNSQPFTTTACRSSPNPKACQGFLQFVYTPTESGNAYIEYWLIDYGPRGTQCPAPIGANCQNGSASTDGGWCPFADSVGLLATVDCVRNAVNSAPAPAEPITSLGQLGVWGLAAGGFGQATDSILVTVNGVPYVAPGNNTFPDLSSQWQAVEFNVFGDAGGDQAVFNTGSTIVVRTEVVAQTQVGGGTTTSGSAVPQSYTGETNNLTLVSPACPIVGSSPAVVFTETNATSAPKPFCACPVSATWDQDAGSCKCNTPGQVIIDGLCAVPAKSPPAKNACGGTTALHDVLNTPCGTSCGRWACDGLDTLTCKTFTNACGACSPLPVAAGAGLQPGEGCTCGSGTTGHYICNGAKELACDCQP